MNLQLKLMLSLTGCVVLVICVAFIVQFFTLRSLFIEFSDLDSSSPLTPADFAFTPPPGVDLFYHDR